MALLELENVTVSFASRNGQPPLLALDGMNLSVEQGELVALVGPSGCGKTSPRPTPCCPGGRYWTTWPWPWSCGASQRISAGRPPGP